MAREAFKVRLNFTEREEHRKFHAQTVGMDGWWEITGKPVRPQRSLNANRYYHAAAVEKFREYMSREHRQHFTHDQCHEFLRDRFIQGDPIIHPETGEELGRMPASSAKLNTSEFFEFVEKVREWLWDTFKVDVEEPEAYGLSRPEPQGDHTDDFRRRLLGTRSP